MLNMKDINCVHYKNYKCSINGKKCVMLIDFVIECSNKKEKPFEYKVKVVSK